VPSTILEFLSAALSLVSNNPLVKQYAEPIIFAVLTGSGEIILPGGILSATQEGTKVRFTFGLAGLALETFLLTTQTSFQVGTTLIAYTPNKPATIIAAAPPVA
jgi:hypothetical protein